MSKSETADIVVGVVLHGDTPEERKVNADRLSRAIMGLMDLEFGHEGHGVTVKRTKINFHSRDGGQNG